MLLATLIRKFNAWTSYRRTLADLSARTDRELRDFGFERSRLRAIAREAARR